MSCTGITQEGKRCRRNALPGDTGRCFQHANTPAFAATDASAESQKDNEDVEMTDTPPAQTSTPETGPLTETTAVAPSESPRHAAQISATPLAPAAQSGADTTITHTPLTTTTAPTKTTTAPAPPIAVATTKAVAPATPKTKPNSPPVSKLAARLETAVSNGTKGAASAAFEQGRKLAEVRLQGLRHWAAILDAGWETLSPDERLLPELVSLLNEAKAGLQKAASGSPSNATYNTSAPTNETARLSLSPATTLPRKPTATTGPPTSYAGAARQAVSNKSGNKPEQSSRRSPSSPKPMSTPAAPKDDRLFIALGPDSPYREMSGPSLMAHLLREVPTTKDWVLSVSPANSGIAVRPIASKVSSAKEHAEMLGRVFNAAPARARDAWTKVVVHKVPSRVEELVNGRVCPREVSEGELAALMTEAFGTPPVRCTWSVNAGSTPGVRAALVSFAQDTLSAIPPSIRVRGSRLVVDKRKSPAVSPRPNRS